MEVETAHGDDALRQKVREIYMRTRDTRDVASMVTALVGADAHFHVVFREECVCPDGCYIIYFLRLKRLRR